MAQLDRFSREAADRSIWKWTTEDGALDPAQLPPRVRVEDVPDETGSWDYYGGDDGAVVVADGERVVGIAAHASSAGSLQIGSGDLISVPAGVAIFLNPRAQLVGPVTLTFVGTDMYFVEVLT